MKFLKGMIMVASLALVLLAQSNADLEQKGKIAGTPHNMMASKAGAEKKGVLADYSLCRSCHVPHKATAVEPLWNRKEGVAVFDMNRELPANDKHIHALDPGSRNCLACHDGSMAPSFPHRDDDTDTQVNVNTLSKTNPANYNLHLFNFPRSDIEIGRPENLPLTSQDEVGCITCHDPHNNDKGQFLRVSAEGAAICLECHHMQNWEQSTHGNPQNPLHAGLEKMACMQCHELHTLPANAKLLKSDENTLCLGCHDGSVDKTGEIASLLDLEQVFEKPFTHPIRLNPQGPAVGYDSQIETPWNFGLTDDRSVRCGDCHNPHAATSEKISPSLDGSLAFVRGVNAQGFTKASADQEYEVCYKCHGQNQNASTANDIAMLFSTGNRSFHPIENVGANIHVPSLKSNWSEQSLMTCSDCHGNDDRYGPQGPHGSSIPHLLKATYSDMPYGGIGEQQLCLTCHDQRIILGNDGFKFHALHIQRAGYSCAACHNPHGSVDHPALLDIDQVHITDFGGVKQIESLEPGHGTCTLKCHGVIHNGEVY